MHRPTTSSTLLSSALNPGADFSLGCNYRTGPVDQLLQSETVLAVISSGDPQGCDRDPRHFHCGLPALSQPTLHEVWSTSSPVQSGVDGNLCWARSDEILFVTQRIDEGAYASQRDAIHQAYASLLSFVRQQEYPNIARMWNYLPHINQGEHDAERYRQFCLGRKQAFADAAYERDTFPSACALGHHGDQTLVYLLAGKRPVLHIENPRQESAYRYPRQYGPASPSFARASLSHWPNNNHLYISGTASILGHVSCYPHDVLGQLLTTFDNLDALLRHSSRQAGMSTQAQMTLLKIYIRNPGDYPLVQEQVGLRFPDIPALYLQADICRRELLVEIDGFCDLGRTSAAEREYENVEHA